MGSAPPGRCLLDDPERCCESGERERGMTLTGRSKPGQARVCARVILAYSSLRYVRLARSLPILSLSVVSFTMTAALVTEEKKPQVPIDDDNDVDDSDEEGAPEIAATDGQFCIILSVLCHP
jgi:hypothetical protein